MMVEWNVVSGGGSVWSDCEYLQLCTHMYMSFDLSLSVCAPVVPSAPQEATACTASDPSPHSQPPTPAPGIGMG